MVPGIDATPETIDGLVIEKITRLDRTSASAKDLLNGLQRTAMSSCQARQRP